MLSINTVDYFENTKNTFLRKPRNATLKETYLQKNMQRTEYKQNYVIRSIFSKIAISKSIKLLNQI